MTLQAEGLPVLAPEGPWWLLEPQAHPPRRPLSSTMPPLRRLMHSAVRRGVRTKVAASAEGRASVLQWRPRRQASARRWPPRQQARLPRRSRRRLATRDLVRPRRRSPLRGAVRAAWARAVAGRIGWKGGRAAARRGARFVALKPRAPHPDRVVHRMRAARRARRQYRETQGETAHLLSHRSPALPPSRHPLPQPSPPPAAPRARVTEASSRRDPSAVPRSRAATKSRLPAVGAPAVLPFSPQSVSSRVGGVTSSRRRVVLRLGDGMVA